jgi:Kef-type K+ transport system membrane component KefB
MLSPGIEGMLFPAESMGALKMLAQVGVVLFMFFVGLELDLSSLKQRAAAAVLVSHASIAVPFFLGAALALSLYTPLAGEGVSFTAFALFIATAMSITAFPVLARIIEERGLARTQLGGIAIACAAVDDVTAWCILAVVVAIARAQALSGAIVTLALAMGFIAVVMLILKPRMAALERLDLSSETRSNGLIIAVLLLVFGSALITESIGIHALFGAFLIGAIMPPRAPLSELLKTRMASFGNLFLLPLFFAFTGLRTQIGLLDDGDSWGFCAAIIGVAVLGKFGGTLIAARVAGLGWHMSASLGALMNTRGLMELIVLNIGYDLGILSPRIFAMMVLMALVTTFMTGPLLSIFDYLRRRYPVARSAAAS